ncbi:uncharacterized protein LOC105939306 [Fundulus heteroclitus]|uniref:uncharacterized protein LOC105939306 n=1 Tax=Fundulus heteroclitus TaxID=8078 RepID=UPI00165CCEF7|nr:uncharacterized protein LOC105939306 [Fundulus heteroclitus]
MVTTKHCCYGVCRSDSRYAHRDHMKGVFFIPFPKPRSLAQKCQRWIRACNREGFTAQNVTKYTYICSLHFVGGKGPTAEFPDPITAVPACPMQSETLTHKRKAPTPGNEDTVEVAKMKRSKRKRLAHNLPAPSTSTASSQEAEDESTDLQTNDDTTINAATALLDLSSVWVVAAQVMSDGRSIDKVDKSCQTDTNLEEAMELKMENQTLKEELSRRIYEHVAPPQKPPFSVEEVKNDDKQFKFYTGLTWLQFMSLWDFLGPSRDKLPRYKSSEKSPDKRRGVKRNLDPLDELFLTLISLNSGLLHKDLAYRFGICVSLVSEIVIAWIQFMYLKFSALKKSMFASREIVARNLPSCFEKLEGLRIIIDFAKFFVEQASNSEHQGNLYSSKTILEVYKVLMGVSPTGDVMFVSDACAESVSDVEIVKQSGFLDHLESGDLVFADRGLAISEVLAEKGVHFNIPPCLKGRKTLTPEEEIYSKQTSTARTNVKNCVRGINKFKLLSTVIPLSLQPVYSQIVFVASCLVNFQEAPVA